MDTGPSSAVATGRSRPLGAQDQTFSVACGRTQSQKRYARSRLRAERRSVRGEGRVTWAQACPLPPPFTSSLAGLAAGAPAASTATWPSAAARGVAAKTRRALVPASSTDLAFMATVSAAAVGAWGCEWAAAAHFSIASSRERRQASAIVSAASAVKVSSRGPALI